VNTVVPGVQVTATDFSAELLVDETGKRFTSIFKGTADMRVWATLRSYFKRMHEEALKASAQSVVLDLRDLAFMNSSCFKSLVSWVTTLGQVPADKQYRLRILHDPQRHWQRRSLNVLTSFADGIVSIET
jgi:hypothetical protein